MVSKSHLLLAALAAFALFKHLDLRAAFSRFYVLFGGASFGVTTLWHCVSLLWRNLNGRKGNRIKIQQIEDSLRIKIRPSRPWHAQGGQFIYLWMPSVSFWAFCQSHPFLITWWDSDIGGKAQQIELLVHIRDGFTRHLSSHVSTADLRVWIDGPHGYNTDFGDFGSILLLATGPGIAAQIPFAKQILEGYKRLEVRTRRLYLVWQLDREGI